MHLPSIFSKELEGHVEPTGEGKEGEPVSSSSRFQCKAWLDNQIKTSSDLHWSRVIPGALYWDGFLYGVRENAFGVYIRNLRTGVQYLVAILRRQLSSLKATSGSEPFERPSEFSDYLFVKIL